MNSNTSAANIYSVLKEHLVCVVYVWVCTCMHAHTCVCVIHVWRSEDSFLRLDRLSTMWVLGTELSCQDE